MKNIVVLFVFLGTITCLAQDQNSRTGKNMWVPKNDCIAAYQSGNYLYYYPKNFHNKDRNPVDDRGRTGAPAKHDAIAQMETANGVKFVIIPENTMLRWENGVPYAHDACGNKIFSFSYLEKRKDPSLSSKFRNEYEDTGDATDTKNNEISSEVSQNNSSNTNTSCVDYRHTTSRSNEVYVVASGVGFYPSYNSYYGGGYYRTSGYNRTYTVGGGTYRVGGQPTRTSRIRQ